MPANRSAKNKYLPKLCKVENDTCAQTYLNMNLIYIYFFQIAICHFFGPVNWRHF